MGSSPTRISHRLTRQLQDRLAVRDKEPRIAILGLGPSAAYSYRACIDLHLSPKVFGTASDTPRGAFWLHWMPQSLAPSSSGGHAPYGTDPIFMLGIGTPEEYVFKQWGSPSLPSSFPKVAREEMGYEPSKGLQALWGKEPVPTVYGKLDEKAIVNIAAEHDIVIQTFPRFRVQEDEPPPVEFPIAYRILERSFGINQVLYLGIKGPVVRTSILWGVESHELIAGTSVKPWKEAGYQIVYRKDIHPDTKTVTLEPPAPNVKYVGRYAEWRRKVLSYEAYGATLRLVGEYLNEANDE